MKPHRTKMSFEDYLKHQAVGSSSIRTLIQKSPAHYLYERENPSESTPAQKFGQILHTALLEPKDYIKNSVVMPEFSGSGSRAQKEQWLMENHGKIILSREQHNVVHGVLHSVINHPLASRLIAAGAAEESIFWEDRESGMECKARPDFWKDNHIGVDIKSTSDASYSSFQKDIGNYMYHVQAAYYLDGMSEVFNRRFDEFVIIAVEKEPPFAVNCFLIEESAIREGRALYTEALKKLAECIKSGKFPAYAPTLTSIDIPAWCYKYI